MSSRLSFFPNEIGLKCSFCIRLRFTIDEGIRCDTPHGYLRNRNYICAILSLNNLYKHFIEILLWLKGSNIVQISYS
jgi:hypothetical protein